MKRLMYILLIVSFLIMLVNMTLIFEPTGYAVKNSKGNISLSIHSLIPFCNDDKCNGDESCNSCPSDCGSCPAVSTSGGGGGGSSSFFDRSSPDLFIDKDLIHVSMVVGSSKFREFEIWNKGDSELTIMLIKEDSRFIQLEDDDLKFTLNPNERRSIIVKINALDNPGSYSEKIFVNNNNVVFLIDVNEKEKLYDAQIFVSKDNDVLYLGDSLESQVVITPMNGITEEISLTYKIRDLDGKTYIVEEENLFIDSFLSFKKIFDTSNLDEREYLVTMELSHSKGVVFSSDYFRILEKEDIYIIYISVLVFGIIFLIIIIYFVLFKRRRIRYKKIKK